jgi:PAS domain S-box-containing protein
MPSILLVEDNDDHAILAQVALSSSDRMFEVERAISAEECLDMLGARNYDAIVMDYSLPKRSGLEVLQDIEKLSYDIPVVMITSHGDERIAVESIKLGAYDYVIKSDDYLTKLPLVLQKAIEAHEMARERAELQSKIEESENRLRSIFENVEVGIVEINDDCSISYANPKARHYLNIEGNLQDTNICALFMENGKGCSTCEIGECLRNGRSVSYELEHNNRQFSATINAIKGNDGSVKQLVQVLMDVTEQRELQNQLVQSERIGALGRMASGVAHDFNNILAAILGRAELMLMDTSDSEKIERGLQTIQQAALDGAETVRRIQEYTGVAKQKEFTKLDVNEIVQDTLRMTEPRWKDQTQRDGVKINVSLDLESQLTVYGNPSDLREVLTNMIFNALDAMPEGGELLVKTYDVGNDVCIYISDTGVGISSEDIGSLFEPFFTTKGVGHTGLGLSVAYGIISRHNGKIDVYSEQGEGTEFIISLPARTGIAQQARADIVSHRSEKANILVIDDEESIRKLLADVLVQLEYHVATAAGGMEGIEKFRAGDYDIVFTDLGMPEVSGWEVAEQIKAVDQSVKIVMITGWGDELDEDSLKDKKIDFLISKPFQVSQIAEVVSKAMKLSKIPVS